MAKEFSRHLLCFALIFLLVNTTFATAAIAQENNDESDKNYKKAKSFNCATSRLSPQEVQALKDLLQKGFVGDSIDSGTDPNQDRKELAANKIILADPDSNDAAMQTIPNKKIQPYEIAHLLNTHGSSGSFAIGIVLDDTLRTGKCEDYKENCHVVGQDLSYRNSGAGIVESFKNVYKDFKGVWDGNEEVQGLTKEQNEYFRSFLATEDENSMEYKVLKRKESPPLVNSILADEFNARMQTNCINSACVLSSYSLFDKYFNSWFSAEMVISNFGPTVVGRLKKAFGYVGRRHWPWRLSTSKFMDKIRRWRILQPRSIVQQARVKAMRQRIDQHELNDLFAPLWGGTTSPCPYCLIKTEEFETFFNTKIAAKGGLLDQVVGNDFVKRKAALRATSTLRSYTASMEAMRSAAQARWLAAAQKFGTGSPAELAARMDYGVAVSQMANTFDDIVFLDWPEMWSRHVQSKFAGYGVKDVDTGNVKLLFEDPRSIKRIMNKFEKSGKTTGFKNWHPSETDGLAFQTGLKDSSTLQLYMVRPQGPKIGQITHEELEKAVLSGRYMEHYARLGHGVYIPIKVETLDYIKGKGGPVIEVFKDASWVPTKEMSSLEFASNITTSRAQLYSSKMAKINSQRMYDTMVERGFAGRRYTSALDRAFAQEQALIKSYFSIKGGAKWTVVPFFYWWAKKGFGVEDLSFYRLPDTWHDLKFEPGQEALYDDAYIDFFANAGSDQGDIFIQLLNYLPWKMVLNEISDKFNPVKRIYDALTRNELRSKVENLAYYVNGPQECPTCSITLKSEDYKNFSSHFVASGKFMSYILEDTVSEKAREKGQTLISFSHHLDLKGERSNATENSEINLAEAIREKETCSDAIDKLLEEKYFGFFKFKYVPGLEWISDNTYAGIAGALSAMETVSYVAFNWAGLFTSVLMQTMVVPKLRDCVDSEEGYYTHYFIPAQKEEEKQEDLASKSTEKVSELVKQGRDFISAGLEGMGGENFTEDAVKELGQQIESFASNAEEDNIVQATLRFSGKSDGSLQGKQLFYLWMEGGTELMKSEYVTEGKSVVRDQDTNLAVEFNNETGVISVNGQPIVTNPDHTRLSFDSLAMPARVIPQTLTRIAIPDSNETIITIDASGKATVLHGELLACIQEGVEEQTGLQLTGSELSKAFGLVQAVVTDSHPNIKPLEDRIVAEGMPRKIATGHNSFLDVLANKRVMLYQANDNQPDVGKLRMIKFENGQIIYKPQTDELLVWLRHHGEGVLSQDQVKGMKTELVKYKNPITGCEEPALDLRVLADQDSDLAMYNAEQFNKSIQHMGPFQVFDTESKRYLFYTGPPPECEEHFMIIDKETGEITDLVGEFEQTPTGIKFTDKDGNVHTLDFSADDGIPKISYNGQEPETLLTAQGRNGAFWYNPKDGLWYAENGQLLPLVEAFKKLGMLTKANPDGTVTSSAAGNVLNFTAPSGAGFNLLNLPSLPEQPLQLVLFIMLMIAAIVVVRMRYPYPKEEK